MSTEIRMFASFKLVDLMNPALDRIEIRDIAHALAHVNRFTGHTMRPYSVAEHSLLVSYNVPMCYALDGLMHDAAEAYLGDVSSPLKSLLPEYRLLETRWMEAIYAKFDLPAHGWHAGEVRQADRLALEVEKDVLVDKGQSQPELPPKGYQRMRDRLIRSAKMTAAEAETLFVQRFYQLVAERSLEQVEKRLGA